MSALYLTAKSPIQMTCRSRAMKPYCALTWAYILETGTFVPVRCDQWNCEYCRKIKALRLAKRAMTGVSAMTGKPRFWTLTLPGKIRTAEFGYKILPGNWDTFRKKVQRQNPNFFYFAVVEGQPYRDNMPHFHILTDARLASKNSTSAEKRALKLTAIQSGFGHQAKCQDVTGDQASYYVSKYTSKGDPAMPKGFRRVRTSQDWPEEPEYPVTGTLIVWSIKDTLAYWMHYLTLLTPETEESLRLELLATAARLSNGQEVPGRAPE